MHEFLQLLSYISRFSYTIVHHASQLLEKQLHLLSKADLGQCLLNLPSDSHSISLSPLFCSFHSFSSLHFFPVSLQAWMFLILKWNKKYLPWSSLLRLLSYFCHFSPSLNTKILYKIDSLTNLAASPPSFPYHLHFLVMSSPIFRFYSHCCAATAHVEHINGFLIVKASDFQSSFHQLVEFTDKIQNSQLNASFGCPCARSHTHTYI